ncbi:MAG: DUF3990 domain-containing protein [Oscillospiraceae bacterium]|jgi:hypothetical protein|nr:DUF3990 domain-containing protein [Oscillospiraceae bacterium]
MLIYHGSDVVVKRPQILESERLLDFGKGFYTTSNIEQATSWAEKVKDRRNSSAIYISVFEFDEVAAQRELKIIRFNNADSAWLSFVTANRTGSTPIKPYDIAWGPVANDQVYAAVRLYETGWLNETETLARLKIKRLYDQILFHTEVSLKYCVYREHKELNV